MKLYLGNLSWSTTEESIRRHLGAFGRVHDVCIPLNHMGKSRGFAFVEVPDETEARKVIASLDSQMLDGRVTRINEAGQAPASPPIDEKKLFVGNLSWRTDVATLQDFFELIGPVDCISMPLNDMGKSRGIAFVTMADIDSAERAIRLLHDSELQGRLLAINVARPPTPKARGNVDESRESLLRLADAGHLHACLLEAVRLECLIATIRACPTERFDLHPRTFEELVAELLRRDGFDVELTKATRDGGRDVIASRRDFAGLRVISVEVKRYKPEHLVDVSVVRHLYGVVVASRSTAGLLVTTSAFTPPARDFSATITPFMALRDGDQFVNWLRTTR
jgi:hypothetical protein